MTNITLKQLRYFGALAHHGHFGEAANACGISQPALTMQTKLLEESLNITLIERGSRRVRLTTIGRAFLQRAPGILRAVDEFEDLGRASQGRMVGHLRMGGIPTIAPYLLPVIIGQLVRGKRAKGFMCELIGGKWRLIFLFQMQLSGWCGWLLYY